MVDKYTNNLRFAGHTHDNTKQQDSKGKSKIDNSTIFKAKNLHHISHSTQAVGTELAKRPVHTSPIFPATYSNPPTPVRASYLRGFLLIPTRLLCNPLHFALPRNTPLSSKKKKRKKGKVETGKNTENRKEKRKRKTILATCSDTLILICLFASFRVSCFCLFFSFIVIISGRSIARDFSCPVHFSFQRAYFLIAGSVPSLQCGIYLHLCGRFSH